METIFVGHGKSPIYKVWLLCYNDMEDAETTAVTHCHVDTGSPCEGGK